MGKRILSVEQWLDIDRQIIAGELPLTTIAKDFGVSQALLHKRIKSRGLVRDVSARVAQRTKAILDKAIGDAIDPASKAHLLAEADAAGDATHSRATVREVLTDAAEEMQVEVTATAHAMILGRQRQETHHAKRLVAQLVRDLTVAAANRGALEEEVWLETQEDRGGQRREGMLAALGLVAHAKAAQQLIGALDKVQDMELRSWGITAGSAPPEPPKVGEEAKVLADLRSLALGWNPPG